MSVTDSTIQFAEVPGYPGYRVGDDGSVWSCLIGGRRKDRVGSVWRRRRPSLVHVRRSRTYRHYVVILQGPTKTYYCPVGRLVLLAFKGPCPPGMEAAHENGNPLDNRLSNLSWKTHAENIRDIERHGTRPRGDNHPTVKLLTAQVVEVLEAYAAFDPSTRPLTRYKTIAEKYGVCWQTVQDIVSGRRRPDVPRPPGFVAPPVSKRGPRKGKLTIEPNPEQP